MSIPRGEYACTGARGLPYGSSYTSVSDVAGSNRSTDPGNPNDEPQIVPSTGFTATP